MRTLFSLFLSLLVVGLGAWAYRENYATLSAVAQAEALQDEIEATRARLAVLRAEWAYLNRPDRLNDLAEINFDRLGLLPLAPEQFGKIDEIPYPAPESLVPLRDVLDVANQTSGPDPDPASDGVVP